MKWSVQEAVGWYGVVAILSAYALANFDVISLHSYPYLFLNLSGSAGILWEAYGKKDWQPVVLNVAWIAVALFALARLVFP